MIKFFRRIRFDLMENNKTSKYFKYAIGEIVLVVIGILIALQINNWNEQRLRRSEELTLLFDIQRNLETMQVDFKKDTLFNASAILQYERINYFIDNDLPYSTALDSVFGILTFWRSPYITATAYNSLQSKGLDILKSDELKNDIIHLYEVDLKKLTQDYEEGENQLHKNITEPYLVKKVKRLHKQSMRMARPNDFEQLKKDEEFSNILSYIIRQRKRGIELYHQVMLNMNVLIEEIKQEIQSRNG